MIKDFLKAIAAIGICALFVFGTSKDLSPAKHIKALSSLFVSDNK